MNETTNTTQEQFLDIWCHYCNDFRDYNPSGLPRNYTSFPHYMRTKNRSFIGENTETLISPHSFFNDTDLNDLLEFVINYYLGFYYLDFKDSFSLASVIRYIVVKIGKSNLSSTNKVLLGTVFDNLHKGMDSEDYFKEMEYKIVFEYFVQTKYIKSLLSTQQVEQVKEFEKEEF